MAVATLPASNTGTSTSSAHSTFASLSPSFNWKSLRLPKQSGTPTQSPVNVPANSSNPVKIEPRLVAVEALVEAVKTIFSLSLLEDDWDSYGGVAPSDDARASVTSFLIHIAETLPIALSVEHDITPVPNGGIQIEWTTNTGHIEFEFDKSGCAHVLEDSEELGIRTTLYHKLDSVRGPLSDLEQFFEKV